MSFKYFYFLCKVPLPLLRGWLVWPPPCVPYWLANWMTEWPNAAERSNSSLTICLLGLLPHRRKLLGWEESRKDGAVNRESLCSLVRVRVRVPTQQWDASLNLLYFIACLFSQAVQSYKEGRRAWWKGIKGWTPNVFSSIFTVSFNFVNRSAKASILLPPHIYQSVKLGLIFTAFCSHFTPIVSRTGRICSVVH